MFAQNHSFNPSAIPNLARWIRTENVCLTGSSRCVNSDTVRTWQDQSKLHTDFLGVDGAMPSYTVDGLGEHDIVHFQNHAIQTEFVDILGTYSIFFVFTYEYDSEKNLLGSEGVNIVLDAGGGPGSVRIEAPTQLDTGAGAIPNASPVVLCCIVNGASSEIYVNGVLQTSGDVGSNEINGPMYLCSDPGLGNSLNNCRFNEFIIYHGVITNQQRNGLTDYLMQKYNIT